MGSIKFNNDLTIISVYGSPSNIGNMAVKQYTDKDIPSVLITAHRAINIFNTVPDGIVNGIDNSDNINIVSALFGCKSSSIEYEWLPTDYVVDVYRAWCLHKRFREGGGEGYFGSPTDHDWIVAGAWINDAELFAWSNKMISGNRLAQLICDNWGKVSYSIVCDDESVTQDSDCIVNKSWHVLSNCVEYLQSCKYHKIDFLLVTPKPEIWQVSYDSECINGIYYPFLLADNGKEQRKLAYKDISRDIHNHFYTNDLSGFSDYVDPVDVTGKYTIYFPDADELRNFLVSNNITAKMLDTPYYNIATVNAETRNRAFEVGAQAYPSGYDSIHADVRDGDMLDKHVLHLYGNSLSVGFFRNRIYRRFLRVPAGIEYPLGLSIRCVGDTTLGRDEIRIFEDGII